MSLKRRAEVARMKELNAYAALAEVASVFADPVRLEIIELLVQSPRSVESIAGICGLPQKNVSYHLQKLRVVNLVSRIPLGRRAVYSLRHEHVGVLWKTLRAITEMRPSGETGGGPEPLLSREDLLRLVRSKGVTLLDVRPSEEYESGHLPRAINIPLEMLRDRLAELPRDLPVVAYCRGPYCRMASRAVELLVKDGYDAARYADGMVEWQQMDSSDNDPDARNSPNNRRRE